MIGVIFSKGGKSIRVEGKHMKWRGRRKASSRGKEDQRKRKEGEGRKRISEEKREEEEIEY